MQPGNTTYDVREGDEWIRITIEGGTATIRVSGIDSIRILVRALNSAVAAGAKRGTLFSGEMVADHSAAMNMMRAQRGVTWLGGKVTFLGYSRNRPEFRIDWDVLPTITE